MFSRKTEHHKQHERHGHQDYENRPVGVHDPGPEVQLVRYRSTLEAVTRCARANIPAAISNRIPRLTQRALEPKRSVAHLNPGRSNTKAMPATRPTEPNMFIRSFPAFFPLVFVSPNAILRVKSGNLVFVKVLFGYSHSRQAYWNCVRRRMEPR